MSPQVIDDQPAAVSMPAGAPISLNPPQFIAGHLHNEPGLPY
jgi:hypothetical protein